MAIQIMAFAQIQNESIEHYTLPKLKRHSLDLSLDFLVNDSKFYDPKTNNASFLLNYGGFLNTKSIQLESDVQLIGQYGLVDKKNNNNYYSHTPELKFSEQSLLILDADLSFRNYFEYDFFIGVNPALFMGKHKGSFVYEFNGYDPYGYIDDGFDDDINRNTIAANVELEVGIGRIEQVQDARHAILIYDELRKAGKVKQEISDQQLSDFARLVSRLSNERIFDRRIIKMEHKSAIDSFLVAQSLATERNSDYYNILSDMYEYGGLQVRESGFRASVSIIPGHFYMADDALFAVKEYYLGYSSDYTVIHKIKRTSIYLGANFNYEFPINLKWQSSLNLNTRLGHINDDIRYYSEEFNTFDSKLSCTIGFYPNTRTDISFELGGRTFQRLQKHEGSNTGLQAISALNVNYYFSPKLRGSLSAGVILQENSLTDDRIPFISPLDNLEVNMEGWFYSIGAKLNYYIF